MTEERTRTFTQSGSGVVDVDGLKLHVRWRAAGTQEYVVGAGAAVDGRRFDISLTIYFDKLPDESLVVQELLNRITADLHRPIAVDLGRTNHPVLYCQEILIDSTGSATGILLSEQPTSERNARLMPRFS
jgi:hypothetical protein